MSYDMTPGGKGPQGFPGGEYALAQPVKPRRIKDKYLVFAVAGCLLVGGLGIGHALGRGTAGTPEACEQALTYAEQGLSQSAVGMEALGDAVGGGYGGMLKATKELDGVTAELNRITPLYKDAKQECLG